MSEQSNPGRLYDEAPTGTRCGRSSTSCARESRPSRSTATSRWFSAVGGKLVFERFESHGNPDSLLCGRERRIRPPAAPCDLR